MTDCLSVNPDAVCCHAWSHIHVAKVNIQSVHAAFTAFCVIIVLDQYLKSSLTQLL